MAGRVYHDKQSLRYTALARVVHPYCSA